MNKLGKAREELGAMAQRLKVTTEGYKDNITKFQALDEKLGNLAKDNVEGIENGIILAVPSSNAAQGVLWPARVRNVVEGTLTASGNVRRNSSKNQISVVFLAPFWNGQHSSSKASNAKDPYALGPLFEFEDIEISEYRIQKCK